MITIGQLADYAGVTIKAVRHYHERGLLAEPPRDPSGYRRYGAQHAVDLVKIKTLAAAGVPLARIKELLAANADQVAAAVAEIDRKLRERAEELRRTRERIARLGTGDRLFVSAEVAETSSTSWRTTSGTRTASTPTSTRPCSASRPPPGSWDRGCGRASKRTRAASSRRTGRPRRATS